MLKLGNVKYCQNLKGLPTKRWAQNLSKAVCVYIYIYIYVFFCSSLVLGIAEDFKEFSGAHARKKSGGRLR